MSMTSSRVSRSTPLAGFTITTMLGSSAARAPPADSSARTSMRMTCLMARSEHEIHGRREHREVGRAARHRAAVEDDRRIGDGETIDLELEIEVRREVV